MSKSELIVNFCNALQTEGFQKPVAIEICHDFAEELRSELSIMVKYANRQSYAPNECLYNGVLIIAPKNFHWGSEK